MDTIEQLAEKFRSPDEENRRLAVSSLAGYEFGKARELLFSAMGDESWRVRKETVDTLLTFTFSPEIVEMLIQMLRSHDNAGLRNSAVETLERLGGSAVPILCTHIEDDDHDVRKFVIDILGHVGDAVVVPLLIKALDDPDPNVSAAAAENLGKIGDARALPHLLDTLTTDNIWLCYTILEALTRIGKPVPFARIAPHAAEGFLKKAVFDCLGVVGDFEAVPLLVEGLKVKAKSTREAAMVALVKVKNRLPADLVDEKVVSHLRPLAGTSCMEGLLTSLDTTERILKEAVITILGIIGDTRAIALLLHGCRDDRLRRQCLVAFKSMGEEGAGILLDRFAAADDDERCLIAYVLGELGYNNCLNQLRAGMRDPYYLLRKVSLLSAGKLGMITLIDDVAFLLDDFEPEVRDSAIAVLTRLAIQDKSAVLKIATLLAVAEFPEKRRDAAVLFASLADAEKLSLLVKDEDAMVRKAAVTALAELHLEASAGYLIMALADEVVDVRIAAAGALGTIGGKDVYEPLSLALNDEDLWVRCAALKSLGRLGTEEALAAIEEVFGTADGLVMVTTLEALADIGSEKAFAMIKMVLDSPDVDIVKAAITMLSRNGDAWLDQYWRKLLYHSHWDVRSCFIKAMAAKWGKKSVSYLLAALESESDDLVKSQISELIDRMQ